MPIFSRRSLLGGLAAGSLAPGAADAAPQGPAAPPALNLIEIVVDTWGADWLGCYGNSQIRTPAVDGLIAKSALLAETFPESLPTLPARRALYTGRRVFPSELVLQRDDLVRIRGWHQLFAEDVTQAETLRAAGYTTALVSDVWHQFKPDKNFHRGFDSFRWVRGQEGDRWESGPRRAIRIGNYLHPSQTAQRGPKSGVFQYLLNRKDWRTEEDWFPAHVFREAGHWLESNHEDNQPFYLHVESFSPHEYWDPPEDYYRLYMKSPYNGPRLINPPITTKELTPVEQEHVRALYGGLISFVDACLGKFLRKVETLGLSRNTLIVLVADHGTMMGEQGQIHKGESRLRRQVTHVPMAIYHPREPWAGRKIQGFVQHTDLMPTLLDILGVRAPARVTGESLRPLIDSNTNSRRDLCITGWGDFASVRTAEWNLITRWTAAGTSFEELYDLEKDPRELESVAVRHPAVVSELRSRLKTHVDSGWATTRGSFARILNDR